MKRFLLVLLLAVAGLAMAKDTVEDMILINTANRAALAVSRDGGTAAPAVKVVVVDQDFLDNYATELPYPYLLNPREALALGVNWLEGDPYYSEDLFGPGAAPLQVEVRPAARAPLVGDTPAAVDPDFAATYATELPYPYLLNPREWAEIEGGWWEGDPYLHDDLFRPLPIAVTGR